jgi:dCMP deaminase
LVRRGVRRVVFQHPYVSIAPQEAEERASILKHYDVQWEQLSLA